MPPDPTPSPSPRLDPDDAARLWDMLAAAREVELFARGRTYADFLSDLMLLRSIERSTEIIGEAARNVSPAFQSAHPPSPEIPWNPIHRPTPPPRARVRRDPRGTDLEGRHRPRPHPHRPRRTTPPSAAHEPRGNNVRMPAAHANCTLGEMVQAMADVYGRYTGGPEW